MIASRPGKGRRGLTVVAVLICVVVLSLVGAALLKLGLARRQLSRDFEHRLQAEWLLESGLSRALAKIAALRDYKGETWSLDPADLGLPEQARPESGNAKGRTAAAIVTISVKQPETNRRLVRVQADYPPEGPKHLRCSQEFSIDLEPAIRGATP